MPTNNLFASLGVLPKILPALVDLGYEAPSPVQEQSIPILLAGEDLLAQAQTGTGKTAAFALPILSHLKLELKAPQAIILTPTRELALQVAETFLSYSKYMTGLHVLPIYGGQDYSGQLRALKRGVHIVVGTPGRVMDHLRRGTLCMDAIKMVVLDEADEMLKMGFIDDVEWILQKISYEHQTALFSATISDSIRRIANRYLKNPREVRINPKAKTVTTINQFYMLVADNHKLEALTRFLEMESFDAVLIFARTKNSSSELAQKLEARGYTAAALNGDMNQRARERVISQIKKKAIDIIVATDVAARGLDIERLSHVISYDIPYDPESYVHRIGRTGRAGREGKALLFVTPRENSALRDIERALNQPIAYMNLPTTSEIKEKRTRSFTGKILATLTNVNLDYYRELVEKIAHENECSELDVAAALACLIKKDENLSEFADDKMLQRSLQEEQRNAEQNHGRRRSRNHRRRNNFGGQSARHQSSHGSSHKKKHSFGKLPVAKQH